jgi:DNA repair protein RadC
LATLSSIRLYDLIDRFLWPRSNPPQNVFRLGGLDYPAIRRLVEGDHPTAEKTDRAWLQRIELHRSDRVINFLESSGFREERGQMRALFVDGRCGLIRSFKIRCAPAAHAERVAGKILAQASDCHADGIILATNDLEGNFASAPHWSRLVSDLYHKGEATEVFLLDHFVLTGRGWTRMFTVAPKERS